MLKIITIQKLYILPWGNNMETNKILILVAIILACTTLFTGCNDVKYNNLEGHNKLITQAYSSQKIEDLKNTIALKGMTFSELKKTINVQCVRKTHQGYYAVLLQEDGKSVYIFIDENLEIVNALVVSNFLTKEDFEFHIHEQMTKNDVLSYHSDAILLPISAVEITAHIVQEGIFIVKYSRVVNGAIINSPVVSSIEFIANQEIPKSNDELIRTVIPFIMEIDKTA